MMTEDRKPLSVYIHVPFCVRKCLYCDFLSFPATPLQRDGYFESLLKEVSAAADHFRDRGYYVNTVYIGGGTPSLVSEKDIELVLCKLKPLYPESSEGGAEEYSEDPDKCPEDSASLFLPEISREVNPGTLKGEKGREKAAAYARSGINRVSIGLQSADDSALKRIGRIHTYSDFLEIYDIVRSAGIGNVNVDIMQDLPDTGYESCIDTLKKVLCLAPEHISSYSLILEEGTPLFDRQDEFSFPDEDLDRRIYRDSALILRDHGYDRYEISNHSLPGYECRHNLVYWERGDYVGLGLGASSCVDDVRWKNPSNFEVYHEYAESISGSPFPLRDHCEEYEKLSTGDIISETMFLGLRMTKGIDLEHFRRQFGRDVRSVYGEKVDELISEGALCEEGGRLFLTDYGIDVSNSVFAEFLL